MKRYLLSILLLCNRSDAFVPALSRQGIRQGTLALSTAARPSLSTTNVEDTYNNNNSGATTRRGLRSKEKYSRLPVWPVWNGVFIWLVQQIFGVATAARLEDKITGRVCPNFFNYQDTSPFIMLVHHCHSFSAIDPLRFIQRTFFPEGFPSHPHRGFITVTYIMSGGFTHRDSIGVRQRYGNTLSKGDESLSSMSAHNQKHTQWLYTGSGILHEEMFDNAADHGGSLWPPVRQELYQLWLNVPMSNKWETPRSTLLGGPNQTPLVCEEFSQTLVVAGEWNGHRSLAPLESEICLLHVQISPNGMWKFPGIPQSMETIVIYVRKGCGLECMGADERGTALPVHHIGYMEANGQEIVLWNVDTKELVDIFVMGGAPIREPFHASGSMVTSSPIETNQAYADYQEGLFGLPWDHKLSDDEWSEHVKTKGSKL